MYVGLLVAGLAGSLHCIGMCGPILMGFAQALGAGAGAEGTGNDAGRPRRFVGDFALYHAGRIWTYAMLGFIAGLLGQGVRHGSAIMGWQQFVGAAIGVGFVGVGLALLGVLPGLGPEAAAGCGFKRFGGRAWFKALLRHRSVTSRLLLGAIMGLLPCGLVYAMLAVVATMPTPVHSAVGMVVFGLGTLPSLTAVLATSHLLPSRWRVHGTRLAALFVIVSGMWIGARSLRPHEHHGEHHADTTPDPVHEHHHP